MVKENGMENIYEVVFEMGGGLVAAAQGYKLDEALQVAQELYEDGFDYTAVRNGTEVVKEWCW